MLAYGGGWRRAGKFSSLSTLLMCRWMLMQFFLETSRFFSLSPSSNLLSLAWCTKAPLNDTIKSSNDNHQIYDRRSSSSRIVSDIRCFMLGKLIDACISKSNCCFRPRNAAEIWNLLDKHCGAEQKEREKIRFIDLVFILNFSTHEKVFAQKNISQNVKLLGERLRSRFVRKSSP